MVLGGQPPGRVGRRRIIFERPPCAAFRVSRPLCSFSRQSGSSSRSRRTRSPTGGCVTNSFASPSSANGLIVYSGSVAGLAWNETSSLACSRRSNASARPCGESQSAAASRSASNSRRGESSRCTNEAAIGPSTYSSARDSHPPRRETSSERPRKHDRRRLDQYVTVLHVRDLVGEQPVDLGGRRPAEHAGADGERRMHRAASRGQHAREPVRDHVQPRLDHAGARRQPLDRRMQQRRLTGQEFARADHPHRDAIGEPVRRYSQQ